MVTESFACGVRHRNHFDSHLSLSCRERHWSQAFEAAIAIPSMRHKAKSFSMQLST